MSTTPRGQGPITGPHHRAPSQGPITGPHLTGPGPSQGPISQGSIVEVPPSLPPTAAAARSPHARRRQHQLARHGPNNRQATRAEHPAGHAGQTTARPRGRKPRGPNTRQATRAKHPAGHAGRTPGRPRGPNTRQATRAKQPAGHAGRTPGRPSCPKEGSTVQTPCHFHAGAVPGRHVLPRRPNTGLAQPSQAPVKDHRLPSAGPHFRLAAHGISAGGSRALPAVCRLANGTRRSSG